MNDSLKMHPLRGNAQQGDHETANVLFPLLYADLRRIAGALVSREHRGSLLQPTALVHEAYLKMLGQGRAQWQNRVHFCSVATCVMRRLLIDQARGVVALRRGGRSTRVELDQVRVISSEHPYDLLLMQELVDALFASDRRQGQILEMRFFGGLTVEEVAKALQLSKRTVEAEWTMIRAFVRQRLAREAGS